MDSDTKTPTAPRVITDKLWDGEYHTLSLSGYSGHLETDTKMLSTSLKCFTGFIKQHPLRECPIELKPQSSLPLTTTMVNSKILKDSNKNPTLPPGLQDSSQHVGESLDSLNLFSRTSSKAGK